MALFGRKKEETAESTPKVKDTKRTKGTEDIAAHIKGRNLSSVIIRPRITEKAAHIGERNVYTFEVRRDATKNDVRDAVKELFDVTPARINIVNRQPRRFFSRMRNRRGIHPGMKKAYVYLKKDDRIDLV